MRIENQANAGLIRVFVYRNNDQMQSVALASFVIEEGRAVDWIPAEGGCFALKVFEAEAMDRPIALADYVRDAAHMTIIRDENGAFAVAAFKDRIA